jgi:hypothetical protein
VGEVSAEEEQAVLTTVDLVVDPVGEGIEVALGSFSRR